MRGLPRPSVARVENMPAVYGNLRIVVLKGRKLTDKTFVGTQAPYLVIEIGEERMVTKVAFY